ncbi:MAG: glycerophosphodiester phosphodiesterase [Trueperaceae bacterium]|nr:glycerophosphodiester phosphodiesterase [Trueperaceae bacterium]
MDIFATPWGAALFGLSGGVLAFIALLIIWVVVLWHPRPLVRLLPNRPLLLGHRGVRLADGPPENSLAAFRRAFSAGLDGAECDVQQSADGVLVIYHDETLPDGRTLRSVTFKELRDALPELATVDELFGLMKEYPDVLLNLELKVYGRDSGGLEPRLARAIFKAELPTRVLVSSFNPLALARFRLAASGIRVALLTDPNRAWWLQRSVFAGLLHVDALHPHHSQVTPERLAAAHTRGLMVNVWTVNDPERQHELARLGVDALIADDPATLTRLRSGLEPPTAHTESS